MVQFTGSLLQYPARVAVFWYAGLIALGATLLSLPQAVAPSARPLSAIDAVFTATSACCVTGLSVRSTGNELSRFGQAVLLTLFQVGGIGIMTITTLLALRLGARQNLRHRVLMTQSLGSAERDLRMMIWRILRLVCICEGLGFLLLMLAALATDPTRPFFAALWEALFHSVSAFCNAGFALHDASLAEHRSNPLVNATVIGLIVLGGIGFPVIRDVGESFRSRGLRGWAALTMHSKMMIVGTGSLLSGGTAVILALEWNNALTGMPLGEKLLVACFQSATTRTAGFETVPMASLTNATLFFLMLLMLVGAGPCSTAGGFKVSTLMVLVCHAWSKFRGRHEVSVFRRSIAVGTLDSAMAALILFGTLAGIALVIFLVIEQADAPHQAGSELFLDAAFEVCSALGTVGLSVGITPSLSPPAKTVLIVLMFLGRLGPISAFVALARRDRRGRVEYPKEDVLIG
jgi:trk system potassium uptake protein TrkH